VRLLCELAAVQFAHQRLVHFSLGKRKAGQVPVRSKPCGPHLIGGRTYAALCLLAQDQLVHKALRIELGVPRLGANLWKAGRHTVEFELLQAADDLRAHGWTPLTADGTTD